VEWSGVDSSEKTRKLVVKVRTEVEVIGEGTAD
jgi:hypothetical protein